MDLHLKGSTDRLNASIKEGRRISRIKDNVDASIQGLVKYIKKSKQRLLKNASNKNRNIGVNRMNHIILAQKGIRSIE